jgi:dienelactone hydrolase
MHAETLELVGDGAKYVGRLTLPAGSGPHPAVLIVHGGLGIDHIVPRTEQRLVASGYAAVAVDMIGTEALSQGRESVSKAYAAYGENPMLAREMTAAWLDRIAGLTEIAPQRIAALGYCFGGNCVLELARAGGAVAACISFHGILTSRMPARPGVVKAHVAVFTGERDPYVPQEDVATLRRELGDVRAEFQITSFSNAQHAFTDPGADALGMDGLAYDPIADEVSWAATEALLRRVLR